jgi:hypothetical protein
MAVAVVFFIDSSSERRLDRIDVVEQQKVLAAYDGMIASAEALNIDELFRQVLNNDQGALALNGQLFLTRAATLERTRANFSGITKLKYRIAERHVTMLAPGAAVLVATGTIEAEIADGRNFSTPFVHTVVFVQREGAWRVIHSHQSTPAPR